MFELDEILSKSKKTDKAFISGSYVYFLILEGMVVYVGQTITPPIKRIASHIGTTKKFDSYSFFEVGSMDLSKIESMLISKYKPIYNKTLPKTDATITYANLMVDEREAVDFYKLEPCFEGFVSGSKIRYFLRSEVCELMRRSQ